MLKNKIKAFTLAEVLITLGIIGIIASIVIPALNNKIQDQGLKTAWTKSFAGFSNAVQLYRNDSGGTLPVDLCYENHVECGNGRLINLLAEYIRIERLEKPNGEICDADIWKKYPHMCNSNCCAGIGRTADGAYVSVLGTWHTNPEFRVDVNGSKGPNRLGKDIFGFILYRPQGVIKPDGSSGDAYSGYNCNPNITSGSNADLNIAPMSCSTKYLLGQ